MKTENNTKQNNNFLFLLFFLHHVTKASPYIAERRCILSSMKSEIRKKDKIITPFQNINEKKVTILGKSPYLCTREDNETTENISKCVVGSIPANAATDVPSRPP